MKEKKRVLLLGVYGMEMVECAGALHQNVLAGGVSHAAIFFAGSPNAAWAAKSSRVIANKLWNIWF